MPSSESPFPTTRWTLILELDDNTEMNRTRALDELCRLYWYPIYAHIRQRGHSVEDAEDLTQGFFAHIIASETFSLADEARGKLRSFLLGALTRFLNREHRKQNALKRGGDVHIVSMDEAFENKNGETRYRREPATGDDPEKAFVRRWTNTIIEQTQQELRDEYVARKRGDHFDAFLPYLFWNSGEARYDEVAAALKLSPEAVRTAVVRLRKRFGESLRKQIRFTVEDDSQIDGEIRELFAAFNK